jgi:hypothetical protein
LESEAAQRLLSSRFPARFAYLATDGTPRVLATWFHWTGEVLAMPTFLAAPHVRHAPGHLRALRANPNVAVTIDTGTFEVLTLRGRAEISEVEGVPAEYARQRGATWARRRPARISSRSTNRERGWPGSTFAQAGSACTTSSRAFRARWAASLKPGS